MKTKVPAHRPNPQPIFLGILLVVVLLVIAIRIRLLEVPLERDEGEYAYAGQLLLHGIPPYKLAYTMKLPGTSAAYAVIMALFGQTTVGVHLGFLLLNAATIVLLFFLARRLLNDVGTLVAVALFALFSLDRSVLGMAAHATNFVLLPALAGLLVLLRALESKQRLALFVAGLLFGVAFLMKQPGILFEIFGGIYLACHELKDDRGRSPKNLATKLALYSLGALLPFGLMCVALQRAGVFGSFWLWSFSYARQYASAASVTPFANLAGYFEHTDSGGLILWILAGLGIIHLCWKWKTLPKGGFMAGLLVFSFLSVCPGFYFRRHYFILLLPAACLAVGTLAASLQSRLARANSPYWFAPAMGFALALGMSVFLQRALLFQLSTTEVCRTIYWPNPFPEAEEVGKFLKAHSSTNDSIAVLGSEPEIYFYADRRSATGYIYMYPLMEPQPYQLQMQQQMLQEIETTKPAFLVFVGVNFSWLGTSKSTQPIVDWFNRYAHENLEPAGLVNIIPHAESGYYWKTENQPLPPPSDYFLEIFQRKSTAVATP